MCTLTIITRDEGYLLGMNRDESIHRDHALPPARVKKGGVTAIYPHDATGGTWIAANQHGIALALLNWNDVPRPSAKLRSRGEIIPLLIGAASLAEVTRRFNELALDGMHPFRVVGVFPGNKAISEWRYHATGLENAALEWQPHHWFSSSMSDAKAALLRGNACREARQDPDAGTSAWLRRLHASHANGPGPFSLCVHREKVKTLSFTEINCDAERVELAYSAGSPCQMQRLEDPVRIARLTQFQAD